MPEHRIVGFSPKNSGAKSTSTSMNYFDYRSIAQDAGMSETQLNELIKRMTEEFPHDRMMSELHVLRACMAIRDGYLTIEEAIALEHPIPA